MTRDRPVWTPWRCVRRRPGLGALAGGALAGALVDRHATILAALIGVLQAAAAVLLWRTVRTG